MSLERGTIDTGRRSSFKEKSVCVAQAATGTSETLLGRQDKRMMRVPIGRTVSEGTQPRQADAYRCGRHREWRVNEWDFRSNRHVTEINDGASLSIRRDVCSSLRPPAFCLQMNSSVNVKRVHIHDHNSLQGLV